MTLLIFMGHPAHFHLFKNLIKVFESKGYTVVTLIKTKDFLEDLCINSGLDYINILPKERGKSKSAIFFSFIIKYFRIGKIIIKRRPHLLLGSEPTLTHLGFLFNIPSFVFSEDDVEVIPQFAKIAYPFVDSIISPLTCNAGKWETKKIAYDGYHKLSYLHPTVFSPDKDKVNFVGDSKYFIIRLTNLKAYHDTGRKGIDSKLLRQLISKLEIKGKVYITSERKLPAEFEKYRLSINPLLIHHLLYYANLYIGDSQSMAVEASLLGTPNIRFNDFVNEIGVLNELEQKYGLTKGIKTDDPLLLLKTVDDMLSNKELVNKTKQRAIKMLKDKINVPSFFIWFIENYPKSKQIMKENPEYQYNFK